MTDLESPRVRCSAAPGGRPGRRPKRGHGVPAGDLRTPATYDPEYRIWMVAHLARLLDRGPDPVLLSLGRGTGPVEAELARAGHRVLAVDVPPEAVDPARRQGVDVVRADVPDRTLPSGARIVVYADGLGCRPNHPTRGLRSILERVRAWSPAGTGGLVVADDPPRAGRALGKVPGLSWLAALALADEAELAGFRDVTAATIGYLHPRTGPRERAIVTAHH
ncbi:hypothetical protein [Embleya sp. NPDC059259]|uniref:hypothetical protein n=1 Tax=unclassified Embleya TaxID=2699296 RepID=UPI0036966F5B